MHISFKVVFFKYKNSVLVKFLMKNVKRMCLEESNDSLFFTILLFVL